VIPEHRGYDDVQSGSIPGTSNHDGHHCPCAPPDGTIVPHLEMATRLDLCVDHLLRRIDDQPNARARETYVDLMVGLSTAAEAMRASYRGDTDESVSHLLSALRHLRGVDLSNISIPTRTEWRTRDANDVSGA